MFKKSLAELEEDFLKAAQRSGRMPSIENRKAAQKAYDKLPPNSKYIGYKFEGKRS